MWFDPSAFTQPASPPAAPYFGSCPSQGPVIGPGYVDADLSLQKNIPVTEAMKFQFRADFFNLFNHVNFNAPSTFIPGGGLINSSQDARQMQFALKFYF